MNRKKIIIELEKKLCHKNYFSNYFANQGISKFFVGENTLGPEMSWVAQHLTEFLINNPDLYRGKDVLDMGAGSGIQGIISAIKGAKQVTSADISDDAIRSIKRNIKLFKLKNINYIKSDLFKSIKKSHFDLIIFNHPFLSGTPKNPREKIYIITDDKLNQFFKKAPKYLNKEGLLIMPFSLFGDQNPEKYAKKFGYSIMKKLKINNKFGKHFIYLFKKG